MKLVAVGERPHAIIPLLITLSSFGTIHALAWNYEFPASWEKPNKVWRVTSLLLTGLSVVSATHYALRTWVVPHETQAHADAIGTRTDVTETCAGAPEKLADANETPADTTERRPLVRLLCRSRRALIICALLIYGVICRLILVGLMLGSLSSLPSSAYQVISWTDYVPHL